MLMSEFLERVPECTEADYKDANALYMALPSLDKDDFCQLYRADVVLELAFFAVLRDSVEGYEKWVERKPYFVKKVPGFHTLDVAQKMQNGLMRKLEQLRGIFGKGEKCNG